MGRMPIVTSRSVRSASVIASLQHPAKAFCVPDIVIRSKYTHDPVPIFPEDLHCRIADTGSRISGGRLRQDMIRAEASLHSPICQLCISLIGHYKDILSGYDLGRRRSIVSFNILSFPVRFRNCLGSFFLLRGQNRVPLPPAIMMPYRFIPFSLPFLHCLHVPGTSHRPALRLLPVLPLCLQPMLCSLVTSVNFLGVLSGIS